MKKIVSLMLIMCILSMSALPVLAQPAGDMVQPYASLSLSGGMAYVTSVGAHYIYGSAFGATESKTVTVTLYRQSGSKWIYVDSVSQTGTASTVSASKYVSLTKSGTYKVEVHGTTNNSDGTVPYYYNVTI